MLEVGNNAPDFCLPNQDEVEICLRDLIGKWIVLYFYPKDNTPGCTTQACDFTQAQESYEDLGAIILGVSPDSPKKHQNFIDKKNIEITLLADEEKSIASDYKVWQLKKMYGKEYMGIVRSTFIINPNGKIAAIWDKVKVRKKRKKDGVTTETLHVDEVREKLIELQKGI
jgi:thioredoxin-dependent peroxiredoxin